MTKVDATYYALKLVNTGENQITSNWFGGGSSHRYLYDIYESGAYALPDVITGNTFNLNGTSGGAYYSLLSSTVVGLNNEGNGAAAMANIYLPNAAKLQWKNTSGTVEGLLGLDGSNNMIIWGDSVAKSITLAPDPSNPGNGLGCFAGYCVVNGNIPFYLTLQSTHSGQAACFTSGGAIGHCTTVVGSSGGCTCSQ